MYITVEQKVTAVGTRPSMYVSPWITASNASAATVPAEGTTSQFPLPGPWLTPIGSMLDGERLDCVHRVTGEWLALLVEDHRASVPDQVAMLIDFPAWLATLTRRLRRIAKDLAMGCRTSEAAQKYQLSAGRISQIRRELYESWHRFHGDDVVAQRALTRGDSRLPNKPACIEPPT